MSSDPNDPSIVGRKSYHYLIGKLLNKIIKFGKMTVEYYDLKLLCNN